MRRITCVRLLIAAACLYGGVVGSLAGLWSGLGVIPVYVGHQVTATQALNSAAATFGDWADGSASLPGDSLSQQILMAWQFHQARIWQEQVGRSNCVSVVVGANKGEVPQGWTLSQVRKLARECERWYSISPRRTAVNR